MTTPISPDSRPPHPHPSSGAHPSEHASFQKDQKLDPTGAWTRFFQNINPGQPVTAEEVKRFQMGLLRWFGLLIAQQNRIWKENMEKMKRAQKGE